MTLITAVCLGCGTSYTYEYKLGRHRLYCSKKCSVQHYRARTLAERAIYHRTYFKTIVQPARHEAAVSSWKKPRKCKGCGSNFIPKNGSQAYCSAKCRMIKPALPETACGCCGRTFSPISRRDKYCSNDCRIVMHRELSKASHRRIMKEFRLWRKQQPPEQP